MKYKVGDIVYIRRDLEEDEDDGIAFVTNMMLQYSGRKAIIMSYHCSGYLLNIDSYHYVWRDYMFEDLEKLKKLKDFITKLCESVQK